MWELIVLAIVQGVAEFLPISSSGHLVILGNLIGVNEDSSTVNIVLHAGTLASILTVYRRQLIELLVKDRRVILLLVVGTIPAGALGILLKLRFKEVLESPLVAGLMLLITGTILITLKHLPTGTQHYRELSPWRAFGIGLFQACALLPGISRSGSTIFGGRFTGLDNESAVTFSFLLAIPAILGASLVEAIQLMQSDPAAERIMPLAVGAMTAFLVGLISLKWLISISQKGRLHLFAYWCIPVGAATVAWVFST